RRGRLAVVGGALWAAELLPDTGGVHAAGETRRRDRRPARTLRGGAGQRQRQEDAAAAVRVPAAPADDIPADRRQSGDGGAQRHSPSRRAGRAGGARIVGPVRGGAVIPALGPDRAVDRG